MADTSIPANINKILFFMQLLQKIIYRNHRELKAPQGVSQNQKLGACGASAKNDVSFRRAA
jgi:hypothetical protein